MQIEPNTSIRILQDVPLLGTYKHTLRWATSAGQTAYFSNMAKFTLNASSYQRVNSNKMRVGLVADQLYQCNYLMFQNTAFGSKWFYAFITSVEYVNNQCSEISYVLDVMQTWYFDYRMNRCFVERMHSKTDAVGDNTIPEPVELSDYVSETSETSGHMDSYSVVMYFGYTDSPIGLGGYRGYVGGLFSGVNMLYAPIDDATEVKELLDYLDSIAELGQTDAIVSISVAPTAFCTSREIPPVQVKKVEKQQTRIGRYIPKNKKLLTYPYNLLTVSTPSGASNDYRYEYFSSIDEVGFMLTAGMSPDMEVICVPNAYDKQDFNYQQAVTLSGFPYCAYSYDTYKAWLAQMGAAQGLQAVGSIASIAGGALTGNPLALGAGAIGLANTVNTLVTAQTKPAGGRGSAGKGTFTAIRAQDFYFTNKHIKEETARQIDDFFNMFGYAQNQIMIPDRNLRPHWTYIKTRDCLIKGSVPYEDGRQICSIFDNGITFWNDPAEVGNYGLDNSP